MVEAEPVKMHTQLEVREMFYETVVLKHVEQMFGWIDTSADKAVKKVFDSVLKAYVLNPNTYISEFETKNNLQCSNSYGSLYIFRCQNNPTRGRWT